MSLAVVVAAAGACRPRLFWDAVEHWPADGPRIHVAASDVGALGPVPSGVSVHRLPPTATIFALWQAGIVQSDATHVAILDIHCTPEPGWLAAMTAALASDPESLCGPVTAPRDRGRAAMLGYLVEYAQFHPPVDLVMGEIPGNNLIVRRSVALAVPDAAAIGFVKTALLPLLQAPPRRVTGACVRYGKAHRFTAYLRRRFDHGRTYAARRTRGRLSRLGWAALTPVLPFVRVVRIHRHARRVPGCDRSFWWLLLPIFAAETAWSLGELLGYAVGAGRSAARLD